MSDWIVAISTAVYTIVTIVIMLANRKTVKLTEKQIIEGRNEFKEQQRLLIRPYLNLYVERENKELDKSEHYKIIIDKDSNGTYEHTREFSIRNIGNGSAKDIIIYSEIEDSSDSKKNISGRNRFMLVDKQYIYDIKYNNFKKVTLNCEYTDLYDNGYTQKMEIYYDEERNDLFSRTFNPKLK